MSHRALSDDQFGHHTKLCPVGKNILLTRELEDFVGTPDGRTVAHDQLRSHAGSCIACRSKREAPRSR